MSRTIALTTDHALAVGYLRLIPDMTICLPSRYDMGLHECLPTLASLGIGIVKSSEELEAERSLVEGTRVWLIVRRLSERM